jgi:hypothetical protein
MAWVRLDDHFDEHPKIAALSDSAFALFVTGLAYSNRNLTDGFIPLNVAMGKLRYCEGNPAPVINELEGAGLWAKHESGWAIHDYTDYQPTKAQVQQERSNKVAAGRAGGIAAAKARAIAEPLAEPIAEPIAESKPVPVPVPVPDPVPIPAPMESTESGGTLSQKRVPITPKFIEEMVAEHAPKLGGAAKVRESIADAMNHIAMSKRHDKQLYLRGWLRRDAEGRTNGTHHGKLVGDSGASAREYLAGLDAKQAAREVERAETHEG